MENKEQDERVCLTEKEEEFCDLYVNGGMAFAGQHCRCFSEVFKVEGKNVSLKSRRLLNKPQIMARIKELVKEAQNDIETIAVKLQVSETMKAVMEETATAAFTDKFGVELSPAPLRAVSVSAAKALMAMYPVRHNQESCESRARMAWCLT